MNRQGRAGIRPLSATQKQNHRSKSHKMTHTSQTSQLVQAQPSIAEPVAGLQSLITQVFQDSYYNRRTFILFEGEAGATSLPTLRLPPLAKTHRCPSSITSSQSSGTRTRPEKHVRPPRLSRSFSMQHPSLLTSL